MGKSSAKAKKAEAPVPVKKKRRGKAVSLDKNRSNSCLHCSKFSKCKDKRRAFDFSCTRFAAKEKVSAATLLKFADNKKKKAKAVDYSDERSTEYNVEKMIQTIIDTETGIPRDLKIDDRDIPRANNFYEFITGPRFLNFSPWAKQLEIGLNFFSDYCVARGTKLFSNKGMLPIEDLVEQRLGMHLAKFSTSTHMGRADVKLGGITSKRAKCLTITAHNGSSITITPKHLIQVLTNDYQLAWKQAKNIVIDDILVLPYGQNLWSSKPARIPKFVATRQKNKQSSMHTPEFNMRARDVTINQEVFVTSALARLSGYLIADGSLTDYVVSFTNEDKSLLADFELCLKHVFPDCVVNVQKYPNSKAITLSLNSRIACDYFRHLGIIGNFSTKQIPKIILQSNKELVIDFIRALIDCDGFVRNCNVGLCMSNSLVSDVSLLMQNLGIHGKLSTSEYSSYVDPKTKKTIKLEYPRTQFWWCASGSQAALYSKLIGSNHSKKKLQCNINLNNNKTDRSAGTYRAGFLPNTLTKNEVYTAKVDLKNKSIATNRLLLGLKPGTDALYQNISQLHASLGFSRVTTIVDAGYHEVYDITVPGPESFAANGIIVHNCTNPKCSDVAYMRCIPVEAKVDDILAHCTLLINGVCPRCKRNRLDLFKEFSTPIPNEMAGLAGQRSSKSVTVGLMLAYHQHEYLKMPNPVKSYGLLENTILHYTVTATTYAQAKETLYDPVYEIMTNSPWFSEYNEMLDDYGSRYGEELYKLRTEFVQYRHKNHLFYPAAPDKKNLRGRTRIGAAIDEIGWLFAKSESAIKLDPDEVYTAVKNSLFTVTAAHNRLMEQGYYNIPAPIFCNISSPSSSTDKIVRLVNDAKDDSRMYAFHYSVYEMNPTIRESDLAEYAKKNPDDYKRDFLAIPPDSTNAFISNRKALLACIQDTQRNFTRLEQKKSKSATGISMTSGEITFRKTNVAGSRLLALDAGWKKNSFAGAIMSLQESPHDEEKNIPFVEGLFELIPSRDYPVNMNDVYENILKPIIEEFDIKFITADRWNSLKLLQDIEDEFEIPYSIYSLTYDDFVNFRNDIYAGGIVFPAPEMKVSEAFNLVNNTKDYPLCFLGKPVSHFMFEALTVQDIMGKKVEKADKRTDDLWRAVALGHSMLIDADIVNNYLIEYTQQSNPTLGVVGSYSNASKNMGNMSTNFGAIGSLTPQGGQVRSSASAGNLVFTRRSG